MAAAPAAGPPSQAQLCVHLSRNQRERAGRRQRHLHHHHHLCRQRVSVSALLRALSAPRQGAVEASQRRGVRRAGARSLPVHHPPSRHAQGAAAGAQGRHAARRVQVRAAGATRGRCAPQGRPCPGGQDGGQPVQGRVRRSQRRRHRDRHLLCVLRRGVQRAVAPDGPAAQRCGVLRGRHRSHGVVGRQGAAGGVHPQRAGGRVPERV
mmetsp:Transcript_37348/g.94201  ORF Transcript_37348/g.94201 Transcript_37348/m.94201 type:complete len:208 (+) Transcript_37348:925-1548(+)